jgi:putative NADH-flavin reductase
MAKILVVGASRGVGLETVKRALARGHEVRALARNAASIPLHDARLERVPGDARDRSTLVSALQGVDAVIQTLGAGADPRVLLGGTTLFSDATRALIDAMKMAGVKRLIVVTGLGAGDSRGHGGFLYDAIVFPLFLKRVYDDKDVQEQMVRGSGLDWTIVRPGLLTSAPASGRYRVLENPADWRAGTISRADVADFLVSQIGEGGYIGKTPVLIE